MPKFENVGGKIEEYKNYEDCLENEKKVIADDVVSRAKNRVEQMKYIKENEKLTKIVIEITKILNEISNKRDFTKWINEIYKHHPELMDKKVAEKRTKSGKFNWAKSASKSARYQELNEHRRSGGEMPD